MEGNAVRQGSLVAKQPVTRGVLQLWTHPESWASGGRRGAAEWWVGTGREGKGRPWTTAGRHFLEYDIPWNTLWKVRDLVEMVCGGYFISHLPAVIPPFSLLCCFLLSYRWGQVTGLNKPSAVVRTWTLCVCGNVHTHIKAGAQAKVPSSPCFEKDSHWDLGSLMAFI